ncbi:ribbon-helix-helix domain-containing protein [Stenoxybacter acetivorans]|uniref:ribbon-helix-helix domain-containing protein n=1 Tax=Stenoxybacter acetivorans TaxID=422441 RepID=UPI00055A29E9|nr:type II toxin-antitoxin system ParD family antitoxin [Stenoxybacter acetivorans]
MRTTQQMSITLPVDMAAAIKTKVQSGEYASESEVIRDGLRVLLARDRVMEDWLQREVGAAYDELKVNPERGLTAAAVRARLSEERNQLK